MIVAAVVVVVVGLCGLFSPYVIESRTFNQVTHEQSVGVCDDYLEKYPNGRYLKDVLIIKIYASKDPQTTINAIDLYLEKLPEDENGELFESYKEYLLSNPDARTIDDYKNYLNSQTK